VRGERPLIRIIEGQFAQTLQREPDRFFDAIVQHLAESNPEELRGIALIHIRDMVEMGVQRARLHGLVDDSDLFAFVSVRFEIAPNFDEEPTLRAALVAAAQNGRRSRASLPCQTIRRVLRRSHEMRYLSKTI
jgi:hypothetical protein